MVLNKNMKYAGIGIYNQSYNFFVVFNATDSFECKEKNCHNLNLNLTLKNKKNMYLEGDGFYGNNEKKIDRLGYQNYMKEKMLKRKKGYYKGNEKNPKVVLQ